MTFNRQLTFFFLILTETILLTFLRGKTGILLSPVLIFLVSLFIGFYPLIFTSQFNQVFRKNNNKILIFNILILILSAIFVTYRLNRIFQVHPIDPQVSDIIPTVDILSRRLLSGEFPYEIITDYGYSIPPTYLPMQWLPFVISSLLNIDHRWIPTVFWFLAVLLYEILVFKSLRNHLHQFSASLLPFLLLIAFLINFPNMFAVSIELLPASYYLFFCLSLFMSGMLIKGIATSLPLLSRFSFVLWLPAFGVALLKTEKIKKLILYCSVILLIIIFVYVLPFLSKKPSSLPDGMKYYSSSAVGEWQLKSYQKEGEKPVHLFRGVGFACYFYAFFPGRLEQKLTALRRTHLILCSLTSLALIIMTIKKKSGDITPLFILSGLKLYMTVFYHFIQVPYLYLQLVPVFVSVVLYFAYLKSSISTQN